MDNKAKYRIGYIDDSQADTNKFKRTVRDEFDVAVYDLNQSTTVDTLYNQIQESKVDALIIDYKLRETGIIKFNGDEIVDKIWSDWIEFPLLILTSFESDAIDQVKNALIVRDKKELNDPAIFFKLLNQIIKSYQTKINKSEARLLELINKGQQVELTLEEEEELIGLDNFLEHTISKKHSIPSVLKQSKVINQLSDIAEKTEEILKEMRKQNESI